MKFISYECYGDLYLNDNFEIIKGKLSVEYIIGDKEFLGKKNKTIYVNKYNLLIIFNDYLKVRCFEIKEGSFIHLDKDLFKMDFEDVLTLYSSLDKDIIINEDGFETRKFGFGVSRKLRNSKYTNKIEFIIAFNEDYINEEEPDVDDIINFYLNDTDN
jgi:hypothetical protein